MGERTSYAPGAFCWLDLSSTDVEASKAFYSGLFGWDCEDTPAGPDGSYTMARLGGGDVAALRSQSDTERSQGVPPHWFCYISVVDVDARAAKAAELGATLVAPPFDVMEAGRMAVVQDPTGAMVGLWEAKEHPGAELVNAPGALSWNDLQTRDLDSAKSFYSELLGWTTEDTPGPTPYLVISNGDHTNGGMMVLPDEWGDIPPNWMPYFGAVGTCEDTAARTEELGGGARMPVLEVDVGRIAVLHDPQGATFAVFEGEMDP